MRNKRIVLRIFSYTVLLAGLVGPAQAQQGAPGADMPVAVSNDLSRYRAEHLEEKLYVHTDKECYLTGEICWFKVYEVDAVMQHPMDLSKVAYLEWLDKSGKQVLQAKIGLHDGEGHGSVLIPAALASGNYILRAYTTWMRNFGAAWFFEKRVTVISDRKPVEAAAPGPSLRYTVAFLPEGGNMIENVPGKVAFRVADQYGRGADCAGMVTEDDADTVVRCQAMHFGLGHFMLTPRSGHRYRATFRLPDGSAVDQLLPAPAQDGYAMAVTPEGGNWRVKVRSVWRDGAGATGAANAGTGTGTSNAGAGTTGATAMVDEAPLYLIAHTRGSVRYVGVESPLKGECEFLVSKDSLGEGVSTLTIFDANRRPVCERLVFKAPAHRLRIDLQTDKTVYGTREKVGLRVGATEDGGQAGPTKDGSKTGDADCSVAVFRLDSLQEAGETGAMGMPGTANIESYLWLASDLGNGIESPDYYFEHPEDADAADDLMLTHGWRRFRWADVGQHTAPVFDFAPEYKGAIITGKVQDPQTGKNAEGVQAYLSVPGTRTQFSTAISDAEGLVKFEMPDFYGGRVIIVQPNPEADRAYTLDIANPFAEEPASIPVLPFHMPLLSMQTLTDRSVAVQVLNRYGGEKLKVFGPPPVDTTAFYHQVDERYRLDDYTRFVTMEEVLREYVRLMIVQHRAGHYHLPLYDLSNNRAFGTDPLILLDGVPVFNIDTLMGLDPLRMRQLDVVNRKFFLGSSNFNGIMNWTTYKGDLGGYTLDPHATVIDYEGLQLDREFYSPSYATPDERASHLPDFRNVLYWDPSVKAAEEFYTSDLPGRYLIVAQGLAKDGSAGSGYAIFEVR